MKIALIGYGKMGKLLEIKVKERNHTISKILKDRDKSLIKVVFEYLTVLITVTIA